MATKLSKLTKVIEQDWTLETSIPIGMTFFLNDWYVEYARTTPENVHEYLRIISVERAVRIDTITKRRKVIASNVVPVRMNVEISKGACMGVTSINDIDFMQTMLQYGIPAVILLDAYRWVATHFPTTDQWSLSLERENEINIDDL